jgi:hypothetical protein
MKEDIKALDKMRDALLTNHEDIIAGKDLKQSANVIANANALGNIVTTKFKILKAEESNSKALRKLGGK